MDLSAVAITLQHTWFQNFDLGSVKTAPDHPLGDYPSVKWDWWIPNGACFEAMIRAELRIAQFRGS